MSDDIKLCKDCLWMVPGTDRDDAACDAPQNKLRRMINLVTGEESDYHAAGAVYCSTQRQYGTSEAYCNASGDWYEPQESTDETENVGVDSPVILGDPGSGLPVDSDLPELT